MSRDTSWDGTELGQELGCNVLGLRRAWKGRGDSGESVGVLVGESVGVGG